MVNHRNVKKKPLADVTLNFFYFFFKCSIPIPQTLSWLDFTYFQLCASKAALKMMHINSAIPAGVTDLVTNTSVIF